MAIEYENQRYEGVPPLQISLTEDAKVSDYQIYGNSFQQSYSGKNLFNYQSSPVLLGTTITVIDDQYGVRVGIQNSTNEYVRASFVIKSVTSADVGKTFYITTVASSSTVRPIAGLGIYAQATSGEGIAGRTATAAASGTGTTRLTAHLKIAAEDVGKYLKATFYAGVGSTASDRFSDYTEAIVVVDNEAALSPFEPYTGGIPAPNPDYPQEIESVGDSPNLLDYRGVYAASGTTVNLIDNGFHVAGRYAGVVALDVEPNTNYTLTYLTERLTESAVQLAIVFTQASGGTSLGNYNNGTGGSFNSGEYSRVWIWFYASLGTGGEVNLTNIQLEKGLSATPYVPYGKYCIPITVSGKNLAAEWLPGYYYASNGQTVEVDAASIRTPDFIKVNPSTKYTLSNAGNDVNATIYFYDSDKNYLSYSSWFRPIGTITTPAACRYVRISVHASAEDRLQFELGPTATAYEPYHSETTNILLDEPLRKIGDYADYIDFKNRKVVREIRKVTLGNADAFGSSQMFGVPFNFALYQVGAVGSGRNYNFFSDRVHKADEEVSEYGGYLNNAAFLVMTNPGSTEAQVNAKINGTTILFPGQVIEEPADLPPLQGLDYDSAIITVDTKIWPSNVVIETRRAILIPTPVPQGGIKYNAPAYSVELRLNGVLLGDVRRLAQNLVWVRRRTRKGVDEIDFTLNDKLFENWLNLRGATIGDVLKPLALDCRVLRNGVPVVGGFLATKPAYSPNQASANLQMRFDGYINYLAGVYIHPMPTQIAPMGEMIAQYISMADSRAEAAGKGFNFTQGRISSMATVQQTFNGYKTVKEFITDRCDNVSGAGPFDLFFHPDRTYDIIKDADFGTFHREYVIEYPMRLNGISATEISADEVSDFASYVLALGAGETSSEQDASTAITAEALNRDAVLEYGYREQLLQNSSISRQETLNQKAATKLRETSSPLWNPQYTREATPKEMAVFPSDVSLLLLPPKKTKI